MKGEKDEFLLAYKERKCVNLLVWMQSEDPDCKVWLWREQVETGHADVHWGEVILGRLKISCELVFGQKLHIRTIDRTVLSSWPRSKHLNSPSANKKLLNLDLSFKQQVDSMSKVTIIQPRSPNFNIIYQTFWTHYDLKICYWETMNLGCCKVT